MRYAEIKPGQQVLYHHSRPAGKFYSLGESELAEVVSLNVRHRFSVEVNEGWKSHTEWRDTAQGIRIRVTRRDRTNRYPRPGEDPGDLLPETYETTVISAQLRPAEGETLAQWQAAREAADGKRAERDAAERDRLAVTARFAAAGYDVQVLASRAATRVEPGSVLISPADAARLLTRLEAS